MVRLRSNRWYSADGQGRSRATVATSASGTRRVLSLCFLLALVVVLMQKASDPKHVRNAFTALGVPFEREAMQPANEPSRSSTDGEAPLAQTEDQQRWASTCRDLVPRLLAEVPAAALLPLGQRWFNEVPGVAAEADQVALQALRQESFAQLHQLAEDINSLPAAEQLAWQTQIDKFSVEWRNVWSRLRVEGQVDPTSADAATANEPTSDIDPLLAQELTRTLDEQLLRQMRDAAPWTKSETIPFLRLLQRAEEMKFNLSQDPPLLSTLQLEAELSVYRGQPIRFRGEVRRVEYVNRDSATQGADGHWSLWLRGDDRAVQPVAVYTTQTISEQLQRSVENEQFPNIEVLGLVGKRLAYSSPSGVEVAPTIFAASMIQFVPDALPIRDPQVRSAEFRWVVLVSLLIAGIILVPIISNWRRRSVRSMSAKCWWLLLGTTMLATTLDSRVQAQTNQDPNNGNTVQLPPWANTQQPGSVIEQLLAERLASAFSPAGMEQLHTFLAGDARDMPDAGLKVLHAARQVGWARALQYDLRVELPAAKLVLETAEMSGRVRLAMPINLNETQQEWFFREPSDQIFKIEVDTTTAGGAESNLRTVFCERVPELWVNSVQLNQPVVIRGMRLRNAISPEDAQESAAGLCWFASAPQWLLPNDVKAADLQPEIPPHLLRLGQAGWDLADLDLLQQHTQQALAADEADAFFTMLKVVDGRVADQADDTGIANASVIQTLSEPRQRVGSPVRWRVRLVNGSVVEVPAREDQLSLGAAQYFQFDGFADMGNQVVHYKLANSASEVHDFEGEFPVTIVMRSRPAFLPGSTGPENGNGKSFEVGQYVEVTGVFYRLWSYSSELLTENNREVRQAAPLIVAARVVPTSAPLKTIQSPVGWFGYALCIATLLIMGGILYAFFQKERRPRRHTR
ncbi:MAG: hypothetical protein R3C53_02125 [Pirellulaceae bacterium]